MRWFFGEEHPLTAVVAVLAIVCAMLLIVSAGVLVHGTGGIEAVVDLPTGLTSEPMHVDSSRRQHLREVDEAVASNRFATGLSP